MNASQDGREEQKQAGIRLNVKSLSEKANAGQKYILGEGCILPIFEEIANQIPGGYKIIDTFVQQTMIQPNSLTLPRGKPELVTFYYLFLEKI